MKAVGARLTLRAVEVARAAGVNVETLRFYERKRIIPSAPRLGMGCRLYPPETVGLIRFIKRAQALGLSLREVHELLALRSKPSAGSAQVRQLLVTKLLEVERRKREIQDVIEVLEDLLGQCDGRGPVASCPIIKYLDGLGESEDRRRVAGDA